MYVREFACVFVCLCVWMKAEKKETLCEMDKRFSDHCSLNFKWSANSVWIQFHSGFRNFGSPKKNNAMFHFQCLKTLPWITDVDVQLKKNTRKKQKFKREKEERNKPKKNTLHCLCGIHDDNTVEKDECVFEFYTINWNENVLCVN